MLNSETVIIIILLNVKLLTYRWWQWVCVRLYDCVVLCKSRLKDIQKNKHCTYSIQYIVAYMYTTIQ